MIFKRLVLDVRRSACDLLLLCGLFAGWPCLCGLLLVGLVLECGTFFYPDCWCCLLLTVVNVRLAMCGVRWRLWLC